MSNVNPRNPDFIGSCVLVLQDSWRLALCGCWRMAATQRHLRSPTIDVAGLTIRRQVMHGFTIATGSGRLPFKELTRRKVIGLSSKIHNGFRSTERTGMAVPASRRSWMRRGARSLGSFPPARVRFAHAETIVRSRSRWANPSMERTPYSWLRELPVAAHVERWRCAKTPSHESRLCVSP